MNKTLKSLAALAAASLMLASCGGGSTSGESGDSGAPAKEGAYNIAVIAKGYASPFWATVKAGTEAAGKDLGVNVTFNGPDTETDTPRQIDQMNQALVKKPDALVFAALDSDAAKVPLEKYAEQKIPVIGFDSGVPGSDVPITTVATDNKAAAAAAAKKMVELLDGKGEVAIVAHSQTSATGTDRRDGFTEYLKENAPDVKVVDVQYNDSDQAKAEQQAGAMLQGHPDLAGFFATDDDGAVAAAAVVKRADKKGKVKIIGFDSGKVQMTNIREGLITGSITQNPFQMGYDAVKAAIEALDGKKLEKFTDSGFAYYDKDNIDDEEIQKAVYE